ncbi:MAG: hypothetical protein IJ583_17035 [Firmicutes bacterium]|nr:hypothetical protein [Bacillota bacterium]
MGGVTHNEILKVLKSYGIKNAVKLSEEDAKNELIEIYKKQYPDEYEDIKDDEFDDIVDAAFDGLSAENFDDSDDESNSDDEYDEDLDEEEDDEDSDNEEDDEDSDNEEDDEDSDDEEYNEDSDEEEDDEDSDDNDDEDSDEDYNDDSDEEDDEDSDEIEDIDTDPMKKSGKSHKSHDSKSKDKKSGDNESKKNQKDKKQGASENESGSTGSEQLEKSNTGSVSANAKTGGSKTTDITAETANSLPSKALVVVKDKIKERWSDIVKKSNNSRIVAFTIDTPVRDYLVDKTFVVDEKAAEKFLDKWDDKVIEGKLVRAVVDDNEYDEKGNVKKPGENMSNFKKIKAVLKGDRTFDVRVPLQREQKVNGIIIGSLDGKEEEVIVPLVDVPSLLVSEYGARIPGDPGVIVNGVGRSEKETRTASGQITKTAKTILLVSYKGKGDALAMEDGRYIRQTAEAVPDDEAMKLFNKKECDFTAKSEISIKVNAQQETTDDDGNKVMKPVTRTVRLSGKVKVPFFKRLQEYSKLGEVKRKGMVANLTDDDIGKVTEITAAISKTNEAIAAKFDIKNILAGVENNKTNSKVDNL